MAKTNKKFKKAVGEAAAKALLIRIKRAYARAIASELSQLALDDLVAISTKLEKAFGLVMDGDRARAWDLIMDIEHRLDVAGA